MLLDEKNEYKNLIEKTIDYLKEKGHQNIKADIEGYESPKSYKMKSNGVELTPDIVSESSTGKKNFVEVGIKSESVSLLKTKWKLLNILAEIKNSNFRIVSHKGHYRFTEDLISEMNIGVKAERI